MTIPGQTVGLSLFIDSFIFDLGLSRAAISLAYTIATVTAALLLPLVGRWIDRYGPRRAVVVIAVLFSLSCFWMGLTGGLITLFIGFTLLRAFGPGALSLVNLHVVNLWFIRRRGTAIGWMGVGLALATATFPPLMEGLLAQVGWRRAFLLIGLGLMAILLPIGALLFRAQPERFGLAPDGIAKDDNDGQPFRETVLTLREARRTPIFWLLTLGGMCIGGLGTGLLFHHFSILEHNGIERAAAAVLFIPLGFVSAMSNLGSGVLVDRFGPRRLLAVMLLLFGTMLVTIPLVSTAESVWLYGSVFGLVQGMQGTILGSAYAYYFGREHIGAIKGFSKTLVVAGAALGPLVYGLGFELFGSYSASLIFSALLPAGVGLVALFSREEGVNESV